MKRAHIIWLLLIAVSYLIVFTALFSEAHCTTQPRPNSLGVLETYDSPWTYMVGSPVTGSVFRDGDNVYTNVEFKPLGASMLNTVPILFCGNEQKTFNDVRLRAVTYRIRSTRTFRGIGCHDILPTDQGVMVVEEE